MVMSPRASLREALEAITKNGRQAVLVADAEGVLAGMVTDGDLRRAIPRALPLAAPDAPAHPPLPRGRPPARRNHARAPARVGNPRHPPPPPPQGGEDRGAAGGRPPPRRSHRLPPRPPPVGQGGRPPPLPGAA